MNLSPSEQLAHSTVRIECDTPTGQASGTGFFFGFSKTGETHIPAIVTNKHVISRATKGRFVLTDKSKNGIPNIGAYSSFEFNNFQDMWAQHPDPGIDLCAMPIAPLLRQAQTQNKEFFYVTLEVSLMPTKEELDDMDLMEEIVMVGYPNGIWDQHNNMPIMRKGVTATHPNLNWNGKPEFLIDAACFPGSSGSPVFLYNIGGYSTKSGVTKIGPGRIRLLGILYAGPQHTVTGEIKVVEVPTQNKPIPISTIPNNLGMVIKSSELQKFDQIFSKFREKASQSL